MKKKIHSLFLLLFISLLPTAIFTSCDKDTNSYLDVLVIDETTQKPSKGVTVEVYQNNCDPSDYNYKTGVTNAEGIFSTYFEAPGIFSVKASLNMENGGQRRGTGTVRVLEGDTKTVEVILGRDIHY